MQVCVVGTGMYLKGIAQNLSDRQYDTSALELFIKNLPMAVAVFDKELFYVAASDGFFKETSLQKIPQFTNPYWYDLVPDMPEKWQKAHQRCLSGEHIKIDKDAFYRVDGSVEWWKSEQIPWRSATGEILGLILCVENITLQQHKENTLQQTVTSLKKSNQELADYAHICAHDLNEPLHVIANCLQIISSEHSSKFDQEIKKYFAIMGSSAKYMHDLIAVLLKHGEHKKSKAKTEAVDIALIIQEIVDTFKVTDKYEHAIIICTPMPMVVGYQVLLKEMMQNLLCNAIKFNRQQVPRVTIKCEDMGLFWQFSVEDNGIGIAKNYLRKIFGKGVRLHQSADYEGQGLGLYQCNRIINDLGGKMWVKSCENNGSIFYFIIPKGDLENE